MSNSHQQGMEDELASLRQLLDAEVRRSLDLQRQLERSSAEFEAFLAMAAHNLREPLREVASFSQLLVETRAGSLDAEALEFLARIREGASTAQSLLSAVVDYWTTPIGAGTFSRVDMETVLDQALLCAASRIAERGAVVTRDPLPAVSGEFGALAKLLFHLIENAVKFRGPSAPLIHVSSRREGSLWGFSVRDNGSGIEPEFQARLFQPFRRLHGREYPGHGLGLAFCKKVVERHGGRIRVESVPGAGSTFSFTLPPAE
jgi:light-regulated signal transduction histidine kinase (bacteriophytochrome)